MIHTVRNEERREGRHAKEGHRPHDPQPMASSRASPLSRPSRALRYFPPLPKSPGLARHKPKASNNSLYISDKSIYIQYKCEYVGITANTKMLMMKRARETAECRASRKFYLCVVVLRCIFCAQRRAQIYFEFYPAKRQRDSERYRET